jgi:hypothetical protein
MVGTTPARLETGDGGLRHAGSFGQLDLRHSEFKSSSPDRPPEFVGTPRRFIPGTYGVGIALSIPLDVLTHRHPPLVNVGRMAMVGLALLLNQ